MNNADKAATLRKAATIIRERGMTRHMQLDPATGEVCPAGAIAHALYGDANHWSDAAGEVLEVANGVVHTIAVIPGDRRSAAVYWNNHFARDADEVAHVLKLAAEDIELA